MWSRIIWIPLSFWSRKQTRNNRFVRFSYVTGKDKGLHLHPCFHGMQIDGYSLDAQKARMKAYADFNDYQIVGEYEDAGKSGKSIEGRASFCRMMEDIKSGKDGVAYVLVFKLSRFGRNAADVLSTLQVMQDFGVNLICVEDGIDSSKDAGN